MVATRGLGFPKGTQLKYNIIDTKLHLDHIICGSTVSCYQKNVAAAIFTHTSTGAIKSINPLTMIWYTCFIWAGLICPSFLLSHVLQSERKALFTQRLHIITAMKARLYTACSRSQGTKRGTQRGGAVHIMTLTSMRFIFFNMFPPDLSKHVSSDCLEIIWMKLKQDKAALLPGADPVFLA